ncbi:MAG: hypothetical protein C5B48_12500 [Candidatus Rokuibacteriota bacterium]|nr:MAG: hypothetical protein C5B48_12500 [Candidatus Rokubacteria bacterium]
MAEFAVSSRQAFRMTLRGALAVALIGATVALSGLAYASPPDPVWLTGVWDDDDADDVVVFLAFAVGLVGFAPPNPLLVPISLRCAVTSGEIARANPASSAHPGRAPPSPLLSAGRQI